MTQTIWEDPPRAAPRGRGAAEAYAELKRDLMAQPGRWAVVRDYSYPASNPTWKKEGYETAVRKVSEGVYRLYARCPETGLHPQNGDAA